MTTTRLMRWLTPSVQTRFVLSFIISAAIPLIALGWSNDRRMQGAVVTDTEQKLLAISEQTAFNLDRFIAERTDSIRTIAQMPDLEAGFSANNPNKTRRYLILRNFLQALARENQVYLIQYHLLDSKGVVVADSANSAVGADRSAASYFRMAIQTGLPYVSPIEFPTDSVNDAQYIAFSSPIRDSKSEIVGVIVAYYRATVIQSFIDENTSLKEDEIFSVLVDENMLRIASDDPAHQLYTLVKPLDPQEFSRLQQELRLPVTAVNDATTSTPGLAESIRQAATVPTFSLGTYQGAVSQLKQRPWQVLTFQPQAVVLKSVEQQRWANLRLGFAVMALVFTIALLVSWRFAQPIRQLTKMVERVAAGDFQAQARFRSRDEFGVLAQGFNTMTDKLRRMQEGLEQQIDQRTQQLRRALKAQEDQAQSLREALQKQQQLSTTVLQLAVPIIPALEDTLVIPLIGNFTAQRGQQMVAHVLAQASQHQARVIIFDVTGVPLLDTAAAHLLVELASSIRFMGGRSILVGVSPEIAQTLVALGIELALFQRMPTLQQALASVWKASKRGRD